MDIGEVTQIATLLVSVLAIIWHQQRSTKELRRELRGDNQALRQEFREENRALRRELRREFRRENKKLRRDFERAHGELRAANGELRADHGELRRAFQKMAEAVADNGRKLARIEGFLGIGMPAPAAARAPGADWAPPQDAPDPSPDRPPETVPEADDRD